MAHLIQGTRGRRTPAPGGRPRAPGAARVSHRLLLLLLVALAAACASGQHGPASHELAPAAGQGGKDVHWLPTSEALVDKMLDLAKVTPDDSVMDLGSGDGRIVIAAARRGVRQAVGIEYDPDMVTLSQAIAAQQGVGDKVTFVKADLFETDLSPATVITMFLLPDINLRLRPKILDLKPGTRIVSNTPSPTVRP